MKSPITNKEMKIYQEKRTLFYKNKPYTINFQFYLCEDSNQKFEDETLANINYTKIIKQYNKK